MTRHHQCDAVILKSVRMGDTHRIIHLLSPELGIIQAAAFGSRKGTGKLAGMVSPFVSGRFFLYHNPQKDQYKIEDVKPYAYREYLQQDLTSLYTASFFAEVVLKSFGSGGDHEQTYDLLIRLLDLLERVEEYAYLLIQGSWRFLGLFGLEPDLGSCASCGRSFGEEAAWLNLTEHGLWCADCSSSRDEFTALGYAQRRYLHYTGSLPVERAASVRLPSAQADRMKHLLLRYMDSLTGGYLNTLKSGLL